MDMKKLSSLITGLLDMAETGNEPNKYNTAIIELLNAEHVNNVVVYMHFGRPVVVYQNENGGITVLAAKEPVTEEN